MKYPAGRRILVILTVLLFLIAILNPTVTEVNTVAKTANGLIKAKVTKVVDGDTVYVKLQNGRQEKVRFIRMMSTNCHKKATENTGMTISIESFPVFNRGLGRCASLS